MNSPLDLRAHCLLCVHGFRGMVYYNRVHREFGRDRDEPEGGVKAH
ncbi:hypothetical protein [Kyrpidia sp.]|nr:hypothetical protein [Kyrpidia sp.]MCL6577715.1 hypothetical protein [Kyrpidia sp.]